VWRTLNKTILIRKKYILIPDKNSEHQKANRDRLLHPHAGNALATHQNTTKYPQTLITLLTKGIQ